MSVVQLKVFVAVEASTGPRSMGEAPPTEWLQSGLLQARDGTSTGLVRFCAQVSCVTKPHKERAGACRFQTKMAFLLTVWGILPKARDGTSTALVRLGAQAPWVTFVGVEAATG